MNSPVLPPEDQRPDDPLLQRYDEANAQDPARPSPLLRERVLAHATAMALAGKPDASGSRAAAANDSTWQRRALGSLAVLGLVGLLVLQFDRGTPEEQATAWGPSTQRSAGTPNEVQAKPDPEAAPATAQGPAPVEAERPAPASQASEPSPTAREHLARQQAAQTASAPASPMAKAPGAPIETGPMHADAARAETLDEGSAGLSPDPARRGRNANLAQAPATNRASPQAPAANAETEAVSSEADRALKDGLASPSQAPASSTALHLASANGNAAAVTRALKDGWPVDTPDSSGRTALMLAARGTSRDVIEQLLKGGASREVRDHQGLNAADHARIAGRPEWGHLLAP